jgi:nitrate/TMAO reductase-like tetraheme cytochrome c subunit
LSRVGFVVAITAVSTFFFVLPAEVREHVENPYKGVVIYLILPGAFLAGLALTAVGIVLGRRRLRERVGTGIADRSRARQRLIVFVAVTIGGNLLLGSQLTYKAVEYMETPQFCGATCHSMQPQFVGHQDSMHASVACAECHVAPGQKGWIVSKMNGTRQLWETLRGSYSRPIPSALESGLLVPSRETCERCHWVEKIVATRLVVVPVYAPDESNSASYTVLMMHVGGSRMPGIHHAHFAGGFEIRYAASDAKRGTIPWVESRNTRTGETKTYLAEGMTAEKAAALPKFTMQCVDCHNRPTHAYFLPERALDRALALGRIPATLPFIKKEGLAALKASYADRADSSRKIPAAIEAFYERSYPQLFAERKSDIAAAGRAILAVYDRNVFPEQKVTWGTYSNNLGHTDFPGCFRCHDDAHATADRKSTITQDCGACHEVLAQEEPSPEILKTLGLWHHIEALKSR